MPNTFSNLLYHIIFSTKERRPFLSSKIQEKLYPYIGGIARQNNFKILKIGGTDNHIHILLSLSPNIPVSKSVQLIKGGSSKWIHNTFNELQIFSWQEGYGAFSVSYSQINIIKNYIENQEEHHQKSNFKNEYKKLLIKNNITFEEKYLF